MRDFSSERLPTTEQADSDFLAVRLFSVQGFKALSAWNGR